VEFLLETLNMRVAVSLVALAAGAMLLSGCGKKQETAEQPANPSESASAPAAPAGPTPEQVKAMVAALPAPYNTGDVTNGQTKFAQCRACHTPEQGGANMTGPNLWGIFGRKAGSVADFNYSDGLKKSGITWDAAQIDKWITDPRAVVPDTRMSFLGLKDPKDRIDVVAYLKTATSAPQ
jgi:cytochrome c